MLTHLRITNFAILDDVALDLGPGFNVLTGETGAGKSLLVDAVALLRGGRASSEVVRAGTDEARIEAVFEPSGTAQAALAARLVEAGLDTAEEGLVVRRVITQASGTPGGTGKARGRVHINGAIATAGTLADLTADLIDLAGQHEHQKLMDPAQHLAMLDSFGVDAGSVPAAALVEMGEAHAALLAADEALRALSLDERARAEREDFLRFQVKEIDKAALRPGEDAEVKTERERLRSAEKLHGAARFAEQALYAREGAIVDELGAIVQRVQEAGRSDPALAALGNQVEEARVSLEDAADSLRRYADGMHADPERLQDLDERLHLIGKLVRKHGVDVAEVLVRRDAMQAELDALGSHEARRAEAEQALEGARQRATRCARSLREHRRAAAVTLGERAGIELAALSMKGARLLVEIADRPGREGDSEALVVEGRRIGPVGWDRAEFLLGANVGEEPRPLERVASGGELSRIMLALKRVLARADVVSTYVFDEVDAGIGGAVADVVGRQLKRVAGDKQVLCVTHSPQIAAYGDEHFHVEKRTENGRTRTVVRHLTDAERVHELARMVGGAEVTAQARAHAEDLLRNARQSPKAASATPAPAAPGPA